MKATLTIEANGRGDIDVLEDILKQIRVRTPFSNEENIDAAIEKIEQPATNEGNIINKPFTEANVGLPTEPQTNTHVDVDAKGVPWSADFHTSNKSVKADGTFKMKPGTDKDDFAAYTAQHTPATTPTVTEDPVTETTAAPGAMLGMPGATQEPVVKTPLEMLNARIIAISTSEQLCAVLGWDGSKSWHTLKPAEAINGILIAYGIEGGFVNLSTATEDKIIQINKGLDEAWPGL